MDKNDIIAIFIFILMMTGFILGVIQGLKAIDKKQCFTRYSEYNPTYEGMISGCKVMWNGKLTPISIIREIN